MNPLGQTPPPVLTERVPNAAAPIRLSELAQARTERVLAVAGGVVGVVAVVVAVAGLVVTS